MRRSRRLLGAAVLVQASVSVAELGVPTLAPFIRRDLHLSVAAVGLLVASIGAGRILGSFPAGRLSDRFGERPVMLAGGFGVAASVLCCTATSGPGLMAIALLAAGVCASSATPAGSAFVMRSIPRRHRGLAMGLRQSGVPLGGLLAATTLPLLATHAGWRTSLAAATIVTATGTLAGSWVVSRLGGFGSRSGPGKVVVRWRVLARDPDLIRIVFWSALSGAGQYIVLTYLILTLVVAGLPLGTAAAMLALAQGAGVAGRLAWGGLSDRAFAGRRRPTVLAISSLGVVGTGLLTVGSAASSVPLAALASLLVGLSLMGYQGIGITALAELAPAGGHGATLGFGLTFVSVAITAGPPLFGAICAWSGGFTFAWALLAGATALAAVVVRGVREPALTPAAQRW